MKYHLKYNDLSIYLHHIVLFLGSFISLNAPYISARLMLAECSTVFLNISWILHKSKKYPKLLKLSNKMLFITFTIFRILNYPFIIRDIYNGNMNYKSLFMSCSILTYYINLKWYKLLYKKLI